MSEYLERRLEASLDNHIDCLWTKLSFFGRGCVFIYGTLYSYTGFLLQMTLCTYSQQSRGNNTLPQAPNPDDPLNKDAAQLMQSNPSSFERYVINSITRGCSIGSDYFPAARGEKTQ